MNSTESYAEEKHIEEKNENETSEIQEEQLSLFQPEAVSLDSNQSKILKEIKNANLMGMTPMDVMNIVFKWQKNSIRKVSDRLWLKFTNFQKFWLIKLRPEK